MNTRRLTATVLLTASIVAACVPLIEGRAEIPTAQHHLLHAALIGAAFVAGILFAVPSHDTKRGHYGWLILTVVGPFVGMLLMWPSEYSWFESHPFDHAIEHLGIVVSAFVTAFAGQRYLAGVGWATGLSLFFMAVVSAWGFGVAPVAADAPVPVERIVGANPSHGATLFTLNCEMCHGARAIGGGGGPSLKGERARKNFSQAQAWIMNPTPPMPKLYPATLSRSDVRDIAAYVESL